MKLSAKLLPLALMFSGGAFGQAPAASPSTPANPPAPPEASAAAPEKPSGIKEIIEKIDGLADKVIGAVENAQSKIPDGVKLGLNGIKVTDKMHEVKLSATAGEINKADGTASLKAFRLHDGKIKIENYHQLNLGNFGITGKAIQENGISQKSGISTTAETNFNLGKHGTIFAHASVHAGTAALKAPDGKFIHRDIGAGAGVDVYVKAPHKNIGHFNGTEALRIGDNVIEGNVGVGAGTLGSQSTAKFRYDVASALGGTVTAYVKGGVDVASGATFQHRDNGIHFGGKVDIPRAIEQAPAMGKVIGKAFKGITGR